MWEPTADFVDNDVRPFESTLREAHNRLLNAHAAALATLQAELQCMRRENTLLRMKLSEVAPEFCVAPNVAASASASLDKGLFPDIGPTPPVSCGSTLHADVGAPPPSGQPAAPSVDSRPRVDDASTQSSSAARAAGAVPSFMQPAAKESSSAALGSDLRPSGVSGASTVEAASACASSASSPAAGGNFIEGGTPAQPGESPVTTILRPGCTVRLCNLKGAPELNGMEGSCLQLDANTGRWIVRLPGGEDRAVRPENLQPVNAEKAEGYPCSVSAPARPMPEPIHAKVGAPSEEEFVEEVKTVGAAAAAAATSAAHREPEAIALYETLARLGLEDVEATSLGGEAWVICGVHVLLRCGGNAPDAYGGLLASTDGGESWEVFDDIYRRHTSQHTAASTPTTASARAEATPKQRPQRMSGAGGIPPGHRQSPQPEPWPKMAWPPQATPQQATPQQATPQQATPQHRTTASRGGTGSPLPSWCGPTGTGPATSLGGVDGQLPPTQPNGLPAFNNAFPASFDARSGSSRYYSQFRVRVPANSQYDAF